MVQRRLWQLTALAAGALAGMLVREAASVLWRIERHDEPPLHVTDRQVRLRDALVFAAAVGAGSAVARVVAQRSAATAWEAATGNAPD